MATATVPSFPPTSRRNLLIAGGVVLLHVGALYALQSGLLRRAAEVIVPVAIVTELITPPAPKVEPPPPAPKPVVQPDPPKPVEKRKVAPQPAPMPVAKPSLPPAPETPTGVVAPQPAPAPIPEPVAVAPAPPAPSPPPHAPARVELPSSSAQHLQNPQPVYPPTSRRLGEQGTVLLRVLIGTDGAVQDAQVKSTSGYDRLDTAALEAVRKWRFVPGKRGGVPEAMWHDQPVVFELNRN